MKANNFIIEYNRIVNMSNKIYHQVSKKVGMSDNDATIIYTLYNLEYPISQSDFSKSLNIHKQTINSSIKKMEKKGLLTLKAVKGKLSKGIHLTKKGRKLFENNFKFIVSAENKVLRKYTKEQKELVLNILSNIIDDLKNEVNKNNGD